MTDLDYYLDHDLPARRKTTLVAVTAGVGASAVAWSFGLSHAWQGAVCISVVGCVEIAKALRYRQPLRSTRKKSVTPDVTLRPYLIPAAVACAVFLVVVLLEDIPRVRAYTVKSDLDFAQQAVDAGEVQLADTHIQRATQSLKRLTKARTPVPPSFFESASAKLEELRPAGLQNPDLYKAYVQLAEYRSVLVTGPQYGGIGVDCNGGNVKEGIGGYPVWKGLIPSQIGQVIRDGQVKNCPQYLDGIAWINERFVDSQIKYLGGAIYMKDVKFINCTFDIVQNEVGLRLLQAIVTGQNEFDYQSSSRPQP